MLLCPVILGVVIHVYAGITQTDVTKSRSRDVEHTVWEKRYRGICRTGEFYVGKPVKRTISETYTETEFHIQPDKVTSLSYLSSPPTSQLVPDSSVDPLWCSATLCHCLSAFVAVGDLQLMTRSSIRKSNCTSRSPFWALSVLASC